MGLAEGAMVGFLRVRALSFFGSRARRPLERSSLCSERMSPHGALGGDRRTCRCGEFPVFVCSHHCLHRPPGLCAWLNICVGP